MKKFIMIMVLFTCVKTMNAEKPITWNIDTIPVKRDSAVQDYVSMQAQQMIFIQNNKVARMKNDMTMRNGTIVRADGTVQTKDGQTFRLKEGDRVYMNGFIEATGKPPID